MWTKIKTWLKENLTAWLIFTLVFIGMEAGMIMLPKWALGIIMGLGWAGWTAYKIAINQKL